jgi:anti-anti-sigma factor
MADEESPRIVNQGELSIRLEEDSGTQVLALYGELDLSSAEVLDSTLRSVEAREPSGILIDLSGLQFIDSSGLAVLIDATTRSREDSDRLALLRGPDDVDRLFKLTGLTEHLPFVD